MMSIELKPACFYFRLVIFNIIYPSDRVRVIRGSPAGINVVKVFAT